MAGSARADLPNAGERRCRHRTPAGTSTNGHAEPDGRKPAHRRFFDSPAAAAVDLSKIC